MAATMVTLVCRTCHGEFAAAAAQVKWRGRTYCSRACSAKGRTRALADRLEDLSLYEPNSGCRLYLGVLDRHGYGLMTNGGRTEMAHRAAYRAATGSLDPLLEIDHLCRNRACINHRHLELVTHEENTRRGMGPAAIVARTGVCGRGHVLAEVGTYSSASGGGVCRTCAIANARRYRRRLQERR